MSCVHIRNTRSHRNLIFDLAHFNFRFRFLFFLFIHTRKWQSVQKQTNYQADVERFMTFFNDFVCFHLLIIIFFEQRMTINRQQTLFVMRIRTIY